MEEEIPWMCKSLVIGTGTGSIAGHGGGEARSKAPKNHAVLLPTAETIENLKHEPVQTNAILHVTC